MKIIITHTDFRIYWPARIRALQQALERRGDELCIVEIAGAGSSYAFSGNSMSKSSQNFSVPSNDSAPSDDSVPSNDSVSSNTSAPSSDSFSSNVKNWICLFPTARMEDIPPARASAALVSMLDKLSPDAVMTGSIAYPSGAAAVYWAKHNDRPVIMFDDARPENVPRSRFVNYIKQLIYDQVDAILCPASPWIAAFARWHFRPEQLFFGVDVVDNDFWARHDPTEPDLPGLPDTYLLAVGRQISVKNLPFLLQVYQTYRTMTGPDRCLPLVLIGEGPERARLQQFVHDNGLNNVYMYTFQDPPMLRKYYQQAAALIMPSSSETWGLVVNEAMAAGLPILCSKACGAASVLVQEGINGYTFSPDSQCELLEALLSFTNLSAAKKISMGQASENIIGSWGLDRFVKGSLQAIGYAMTNKKKCRSVPARFVLKNWKGRYRPV